MTNPRQARALAIKLSRQRRAGEEIPPPPRGRFSEGTRQRAMRDLEVGRKKRAEKHAKKARSPDVKSRPRAKARAVRRQTKEGRAERSTSARAPAPPTAVGGHARGEARGGTSAPAEGDGERNEERDEERSKRDKKKETRVAQVSRGVNLELLPL
jgi:hypothetical protein